MRLRLAGVKLHYTNIGSEKAVLLLGYNSRSKAEATFQT